MSAELDGYKQKRDFEKTPEPKGKTQKSAKNLRFVVQHHLARRDHYDFRLEWDGALLSWAVPKGPSYCPRDKRLAVRVEEHPLEYRHFEGTIPQGEYGGGTVMLWDEGFWQPLGNAADGLREGALKFALKGERLKGNWSLVRLKEDKGKENWLLLKEKDEFAQDGDGISHFSTSVRTGRTMEQIEAGEKPNKQSAKGADGVPQKAAANPFSSVAAQLARPVDSVPEGKDWLFELKYDGYRTIAYVENDGVRLVTRNGNDYTKHFKEIAESLKKLANGRAMVLDGETVVVDDEGKTDFQALQNYMKKQNSANLVYIIFDLLALDGEDLRMRPLSERKQTLEQFLIGAPQNLCFSRHVVGRGKECADAACASGHEGIVGKKARSVYGGTRNGDWIKFKCAMRQEFVICGYTQSDKKTAGISSLILGVYQDGKLVYAGRAGTGFSEADRMELQKKLAPKQTDKLPFTAAPKSKTDEKIFWVRPEFAAEVEFAEWTKENLLRQASFKGLRTDKDLKDITRETAVAPLSDKSAVRLGNGTLGAIRITNPDKVIFNNPKITKGEIAQYYQNVAERMLPYIAGRLLSIVRCPKGVKNACFFKKHPDTAAKGIVKVPVKASGGETDEYFYVENAEGLIYEAQMGTLEFHTWGSRADRLEKPDIMVFDLDPDEGMELSQVRRGALDIKSVLAELSLTSYLKTSGGKGYHVVIPFVPSVSWEEFHGFAKRVAQLMEQRWPDRYTSNVRKAKRKNRIFIDWIRNGKGATSVAPYSLRAREGAAVSMPISWDELDKIAPDGVDIKQAQRRLTAPDPWQDFFKTRQKLNPRLLKSLRT
jgi:bifunctional non-homologous end joining protein LigD